MNKKVFTILKIAISILLVYFLFSRVSFTDVLSSALQLSLGVIVSAILFYVAALLVNTFKWKLFLPEQTFKRLLQFTFIDVFYGMALPGQVSGEIAKAYRLGVRTGDIKRVAISVWMDKITGLIGLMILVFVGIIFSSRSFPPLLYFLVTLFVVLGIASLYVFDIQRVGDFFLRCARWPFLKNILLSLKEFKKSHSIILLNIFLGALYQIFSILITMVFASAFGIHISIIDWFWIFGLVSFLQFLPISIAGLGVREVSFVSILALFSVQSADALALSFSMFGIQLLFASIGFFIESHYNLSHS